MDDKKNIRTKTISIQTAAGCYAITFYTQDDPQPADQRIEWDGTGGDQSSAVKKWIAAIEGQVQA